MEGTADDPATAETGRSKQLPYVKRTAVPPVSLRLKLLIYAHVPIQTFPSAVFTKVHVHQDRPVTSKSSKKTSAPRERYKMGDLPEGMTHSFIKEYLPLAKAFAGRKLEPWENLSVKEIQELMRIAYPGYEKEYKVEAKDVYCNLVSRLLSLPYAAILLTRHVRDSCPPP